MEIWMVGDCQAMVDGELYDNPNGIDGHVAAVRSIINQAEIKKCRSREWIMENDPGAEFIGPLLTEQLLFQNGEAFCESCFAYCAFDGFDIDLARIKVLPVKKGSEIVLASDGYPTLCATLYESEKRLTTLLEADPLCIFENKCVKGVAPGNVSYDDRCYIRFKV
jgi:glycerophosphoryl diester phosphodiesterase